MILSDRDLRALLDSGRLDIEPLAPDAVQPSSIDLRVGNRFRVFANHRYPLIDPRQPMEGLTELVEAKEDEPFILHPGEFVLGTTFEQVTLPDDVVAQLEGKSSLGRLGLLIHSSLPGSEPVLFLEDGSDLRPRPIEELVRERVRGCVAAFDPDTFEVGLSRVTGWYEGPADRIFEVVLASDRRVRVTAGHNLFTLDREGRAARVRTGELTVGTPVAVPARVPGPPEPTGTLDVLARASERAPERASDELVLEGPRVAAAFDGSSREAVGLPRGGGTAPVASSRSQRHPPLLDRPVEDRPAGDALRSAHGDLRWDRVVEVRDTGSVEPVYDLEVRPGGRKVENFLAGYGGVFVSNTAGFVDAGFSGHLTLELSNVANLPIAIYPRMKIGSSPCSG